MRKSMLLDDMLKGKHIYNDETGWIIQRLATASR
jgi:hypothetical protein